MIISKFLAFQSTYPDVQNNLAEATLMAGLKNAFYHRINNLRRTEEPIVTKKDPIGTIMLNERGELKALKRGMVKAGPTKLLVLNQFDQSVRFLTSDSEKVIFQKGTSSNQLNLSFSTCARSKMSPTQKLTAVPRLAKRPYSLAMIMQLFLFIMLIFAPNHYVKVSFE